MIFWVDDAFARTVHTYELYMYNRDYLNFSDIIIIHTLIKVIKVGAYYIN